MRHVGQKLALGLVSSICVISCLFEMLLSLPAFSDLPAQLPVPYYDYEYNAQSCSPGNEDPFNYLSFVYPLLVFYR